MERKGGNKHCDSFNKITIKVKGSTATNIVGSELNCKVDAIS